MSLFGIAAIIGGAAAVASGIGSMFEGKSNRDYNESLASQAQDFQREMFTRQNQEYDRRFAKESEYNDPRALMSRYAQAGVNPVFGLGGNQTATFGAPSPSVSPSPSSPPPPYLNMSANGDMANYMDKVGSLLSNIAKSNQDSVAAQQASRMADDLLKNLQLKNRLEAQDILDKEIEVLVKKNTALEKAWNDIRLQRVELNYKTILGQNVEFDNELKQWQTITEQAKSSLSQAEYLKFMESWPLEVQNMRAYHNVLTEQTRKYRAEGDKAFAETKTENDLRKWKVENLRLENEGKSISNIFASASQGDKLKIIKANLSQAQFEARMAEVRKMDMEGYSALHRLLFSDTHQGGDFEKAYKLMQKQAFRDAIGF